MARVRVFEAAKEYGYEVQDLLAALVQVGVKVRSHLSPVDEAELGKAIATLGGAPTPAAAPAAPAKPRTVVRRRKKADTEAVEEPVEEIPDGEPAEVAAEEPAQEPTEVEAMTVEAVAPSEEVEEIPESPAADGAAEDAPVVEPAEAAPAADEAEPKEEFGLKVVRFIHPPVEERAAPAPSTYHMTKKEREARRVDKKAKGRKKGRRPEVETGPRRTMQQTQITVPKASKRKIRVNEVITVSELSQRIGVKATELIKQLMGLGVLVTINQTIDADTAALVAAEFEYEVENIVMGEEEMLAQDEDKAEDLVPRSPVITVMGHVDHGKTSLLDRIRETRVAAGEAGGITQHIGAYEVETSRGRLVFLDTPGHEAFTALRARGAQVTDITVLVVAANDGIMPQTVEAIAHSKAAGVPIIVAINKMDLADANPDRVKRELTEHELAPEGWGGDVICVPLSAKTGDGVDTLLEMIALQAEILELKANPNKPAQGTVVEARVDRGRGVMATVLVQEGTLKVGDIALVGQHYGRVRALINDQGKRIKEVGPSTPVEVTGLSGVPIAGQPFVTVENERVAKDIAGRRTEKIRAEDMSKTRKVTLADFHEHLAEGAVKDLPIIIKADVHGSMEALGQSLEKLSNDEVKVKIIHGAVGGITENDVNLATASNAIIIGFNVRPEAKAAALASGVGVDIRLYNVIYDASDDVKRALEGLLTPTIQEKTIGHAEVRQIFKAPKVGTIAGCYVTQGVVQRNARVRLLRDSVVVFTGELDSLKRFKDDAKEVREGFECGLSIVNYNDIKEGDTLEFFVLEEIKRTL
ncbi:MAG: translation initiation factor IF-2 [Deferrisomatales bacterium]|nr:translation initiation factor IF-2 [Deferrisomatales bacterium]